MLKHVTPGKTAFDSDPLGALMGTGGGAILWAGQGKRSLAYSIFYQAEDRTLTDDEVNALHERILARLKQRFSAEIRGWTG